MRIYDVKTLQMKELAILKEIMSVCDKNGLRYYAVAGTCLGAVRHHGFIPWDDDIDIGMPREDFDRFRRIAKSELPVHLALLDFQEALHAERFFLKVHDTSTTFIENEYMNFEDQHTGVFVDIFPYDGFPKPGLHRCILTFRLKVLKKVNLILRMPSSFFKKRWERAASYALFFLKALLPYNWAATRIEVLLRCYKLERNPYSIAGCDIVLKSRYFLETQELAFEDTTVPCSLDYDGYLRDNYGDYMKLPPKEKQKTNHEVALYSLEIPFAEYKDQSAFIKKSYISQ